MKFIFHSSFLSGKTTESKCKHLWKIINNQRIKKMVEFYKFVDKSLSYVNITDVKNDVKAKNSVA
jgi:hypothetical protein